MAIALLLRNARDLIGPDSGEAAAMLERASSEFTAALEDLRELAQGIHPPILSERGLAPALEALAGRVALPVRLDLEVEGRLPGALEVGVYYTVAEALANVVKHASASAADVSVRREEGRIRVEVTDDGVGGADAGGGSGLRGLADRVEALGGTFTVESPAGGGTRVRADLATG